MKTVVLTTFATAMFLIGIVALDARAGDDRDRADSCWQVVAAKNRIVFANTCTPEASFAVKVKDLSG
jgi:hypothetical protein